MSPPYVLSVSTLSLLAPTGTSPKSSVSDAAVEAAVPVSADTWVASSSNPSSSAGTNMTGKTRQERPPTCIVDSFGTLPGNAKQHQCRLMLLLAIGLPAQVEKPFEPTGSARWDLWIVRAKF